jgi:phage gpG-like protein
VLVVTGSVGDAARRFERAARETRRSRGLSGMVRLSIVDDTNARGLGVDRVFDALGATLRELEEVLRDTVPTIRAAHRATFTSEGARGRGAWAPLAARTLADRRRKGYPPGPILVRSGKLAKHVLTTPAVIRRTGREVTLTIAPTPQVRGTGRPYYRVQALGGGPSSIPARPMVAIGSSSATKVSAAVSRNLQRRYQARLGR